MSPPTGARRGRVTVVSLGAGVLLALSLPPWGWWPLGVVGAAVLYRRLDGLPTRARAWAGWVAGLGCFGIGLAWARTFNWYGTVVLVVVEAGFMAAAAAATPPRRGRGPAFVGAFTVAEWVRMTWPFGGLPLGGVFLGQAHGPLVQLARLGGPLLMTSGVWAGGVALATLAAWARCRVRGVVASPSAVPATVVALGVVLLVAAGSAAPDGGAPVRQIRVALVQGGGPRGLSKEEVDPVTVYEAQVAATRAVVAEARARRHGPDLVVWPEDRWPSTVRWPARQRRHS